MSEDPDVLVERFIDNELTRDERRALLRLIAARPEVRERVLQEEAMLDAVARLPRPIPAADFTARILERLPAEERPRRPLPLARFWATAAAAGLLLATGFWIGRVRPTPPVVPVADRAPAPRQAIVRLVLIEPKARSVTIVGDFNGWDPARTPLTKGASGVWSTALPLPPGRYHYMFVVDENRWVADPLASETSLDGFGAQNSVLDVET
jgi:anti-sigma factor RsiW